MDVKGKRGRKQALGAALYAGGRPRVHMRWTADLSAARETIN